MDHCDQHAPGQAPAANLVERTVSPRPGLEQSAAELVVLSFADDDLAAFAAASRAADGLPRLHLANLRDLVDPHAREPLIATTLAQARGILIRLGGGLPWPDAVARVAAMAAAKGIALAIVPGDGQVDPQCDAASNLPPSTLRRLKALCDKPGPDSARAALVQLALASGLRAAPLTHATLPPSIAPTPTHSEAAS
ncbi:MULTISPECIES: hypothetical protein [Rhodopseudomonas]|uniref:TIR domain-containing protein n=1 Tax=Rhodopseudomonas palustris TaxID=1076 RepID=A0A0D7DZ70_RHOPL|nr:MULTISPECIES: hypothetical protein [Rhodopseudomonas]KIZ33883.1 hypothetical protein OO17_27850 [Rhodopseudomonas palustris]MDF3814480.1 hypothetical protein [Rhodopseudomonas sp. BAL398]WOK18858.1 hypothetical protein RBJ75_04845 [Rhodopseudomonas sp. BAL398]